jgi:hypothetical protein
MKFALTLACLVFAALQGSAQTTFVFSNGAVTSTSMATPPAFIPSPGVPTASPSGGCYQDAAGNWICPLNGKIVKAAPAPQACYSSGCPCLPAKTPFDPATNCGMYSCAANGGTGNCSCMTGATEAVNFAGDVSFPLPMAGAAFFLDAAGRHRRHPFVHMFEAARERVAQWNQDRPKLVQRRK